MAAPVQPGERLVIRADTWNALLDTQRRLDSGEFEPLSRAPRPESDPLWARNDTGSDLPRLGVCVLSAPLYGPTDNLTQFLERRICFKAVAPTAGYQTEFAITLEPIAAGRIGRVRGAGLMQVKINVTDEANQWAICTVNMTRLETRPYGTARILWKEAGTGEKWGVVRLDLFSPPFRIQFPAAVAANASAACQYYTTAGLSTQTVTIFNRSGGSVGAAGRIGYAYLNSQERELQFIQESCP